MDIDAAFSTLSTLPTSWGSWDAHPILEALQAEKSKAVATSDQERAKRTWCCEQAILIHEEYINAFRLMKRGEFYNAWCNLEKAERGLGWLERHFPFTPDDYHLAFTYQQIGRFQKLFPYAYFASPEMVAREKTCNICGARVSIRSPCGHRVGEVYNGELCVRKVSKSEFIGIALVRNPVQKYSVPFLLDPETSKSRDHYDYSLINFIVDRLASPYHGWSFEWTKKRHPHARFKSTGRNDPCPCESGVKYKKCCWSNPEGVLRPHCEIDFEVPPPSNLSMFTYSKR
ncbi:MAG TPA: SEC-C metal-binding domain-containing protein [Archangium sp.]|uniref:SEC-C metal-binding domain-containing protein n=1 Tax=Archangium sp. TaxID=1872627 RepID=UPI002E34DD56|nr:SEC-C metal-binding domain-containing protein [Archangium sp.]HEX5754016.1 SEC-C metal-binding domain-containing protein [Archangium sp.]